LGIPPELVRLLVDIDINGTAQVITPVGLSEKYRVETGVRQGEVLSPLKFILWIDPLVRWLHESVRLDIRQILRAAWIPQFPQIFREIQQREHQQMSERQVANKCQEEWWEKLCGSNPGIAIGEVNIRCLFFADDIWLAASSRWEAQCQLWKVQQFTERYGISLCSAKSAWTTSEVVNAPLPLYLEGGLHLPKVPDNATYKYLGVPLTTKCNFKVARLKLDTRVRSIVAAVRSSRLSAREAICVFNAMVGGYLRYFLKVVTVPASQLKEWTDCICAVIKKCHGMPRCSPSHSFWIPQAMLSPAPINCLDLAHRVLVIQTLNDLNSTATVGQLSRFQRITAATLKEQPCRSLARPWDNGSSAWMYLDYTMKALVHLQIEVRKAGSEVVQCHRQPVDFPLAPLYGTQLIMALWP